MQRLRGSYALGVVSMDNTQEIVAARRGNPLVIGIGEGENMIASDITAIISRTRKFIILDDNEVAIVRPDEVIVMNEFGDKVEKEVQTVNWDMSAAEKGGYQHFMLKEIMEQPKAVTDTVTPRIKNNAVCFEDNGLTDERLRDIENIHIIGCGSALACRHGRQARYRSNVPHPLLRPRSQANSAMKIRSSAKRICAS